MLAAGLFAVAPTAVREAHFVLTDTPLAFFTALALLLSLRALEEPGLTRLALAGAAAGLAGATEYPGMVSAVMPLAAASLLAAPAGVRLSRVAAVVGSGAAAFVLAAPYTVLDLPGFLNGFAELSSVHACANPDAWRTQPHPLEAHARVAGVRPCARRIGRRGGPMHNGPGLSPLVPCWRASRRCTT